MSTAVPAAGAADAGGKVSDALARVEKDLAALWASPDEGSGQAKVRAAMINLVVVAPDGDPSALRVATDRFTESHPGRVFFVSLDMRAEPWALRHEVSAACRADGGQVVCSDRLELAFGSMVASRAQSLVAALSLPEVPTVVECRPGAARALIAALAPGADRLVVDSGNTSWKGIGEILQLARGKLGAGHGPGIADRQYLREQGWRRLLAEAFDAAPAATRAIRRVEVTCTPGGTTGTGAPGNHPSTLLVAWLAARLGWQLESADRARDAAGRPVQLARAEEERNDVGRGAIVSIRIDAELDGAPMQVSVARGETPWLVRWETTGAQRRGGQHSLAREDEVRVLVEAVDSHAARGPGAASPGREAGATRSATFDAVYAETARVAQELAAMLAA
ncbi:MAG: glucose-6-phosphate dehydrogenase assembly protein OpcA [Polyangiaceae bacterium]